MAARSVHVCRHLYPSGDERRLRGLKEAHSSCVLAARTISNMPGYQFSLRVKEIRTCFQYFFTVTGSSSASGNSRFGLGHR